MLLPRATAPARRTLTPTSWPAPSGGGRPGKLNEENAMGPVQPPTPAAEFRRPGPRGKPPGENPQEGRIGLLPGVHAWSTTTSSSTARQQRWCSRRSFSLAETRWLPSSARWPRSASAILARPLGGVVMSHFGDRIGRKQALMITLVIMGVASIGIGFLPTYGQVGYWATALLLVGRLAQGFSAGAESAGAINPDHGALPGGRRGFFTELRDDRATPPAWCSPRWCSSRSPPSRRISCWAGAGASRSGFRRGPAVAYWIRTRLEEPPVFEETVKRRSPRASRRPR